VEVREINDKVIFLHKVSPGGADHSYGIQVAKMAGLPSYVTERAKKILFNLEDKELTPYEIKSAKLLKKKNDEIQYNLFEFKDDNIRKELEDLSIDTLTPLDALNKLHELKKQIKETK
jgi:DNA mismatch repair protein MutS